MNSVRSPKSKDMGIIFQADAPFEMSYQTFSLFEKIKQAVGSPLPQVASPGKITVTATTISFPNYLNIQRTLGGSANETTFLLTELVDFEIVPGSGSKRNHVPRHFRVETKNQFSELTERHFKCTISAQDEVRMLAAMRSKLAFKGPASPFSVQSETKRTSKAKMKSIAGISLVAAIFGTVILTMLNPPFYVFSAMASLFSVSAFLGVILSLLLKETVMSEYFSPGPGRELKFTELLILTISSVSLILYLVNNFGPPRQTISQSFSVSNTFTSRSKGKTYYKAEFLVSPKIGSQFFDFKESTQMRISQSEFSQIQIGKSYYQIQGVVGTLGIPVIKRSNLVLF